ncbi:unnamed protein product [Linum trigynum]|uniref:Uncharacterized protein n=1 Tax=Linum trigynum TaxID=586398 RepID=A0AAV2FU58_9ROSI
MSSTSSSLASSASWWDWCDAKGLIDGGRQWETMASNATREDRFGEVDWLDTISPNPTTHSASTNPTVIPAFLPLILDESPISLSSSLKLQGRDSKGSNEDLGV